MLSYRWLLSSGCIALFLSGCGQTKSLSSREISQQVKASVVLISYQDKGGNGTGFFVQGGKDVCTLVTARHVVEGSEKLQVQTPNRKLIKDINIQRFPDHDLAVLTFQPEGQNCPYPNLSLGNSDSVQVGDQIYIIGFPGRDDRLVAQFVRGDVSAIENPPLANGYGISYPVTTAGGMSGGPVVNIAGQVIAVHGLADTEVARVVELKGGEMPPSQQQASISNDAGEVAARVGTFKWAIPINLYLANVPKFATEVVDSSTTFPIPKEWLFFGFCLGILSLVGGSLVFLKPIIYCIQGDWLSSSQQYKKAITSYDKAIQFKPDYSDAWYNRGNALGELKRYDDAIASYDKAIQFKSDLHEAWYNRGNALGELKRYDDAIASYDKAIQFKSDLHEAWYNRGNALGELKRYDDAIASYDKAIQFKPDLHEAWHNRGNALGELKRYDDAIASYDKAIQFKPDLHEAWYNRGIALGELKRYDDAIASYDKAIQFKPDLHEAWYNRGNALNELKRYDDAIASYDQAIQFKSDYSDAWYNRGVALGELKRYDDAIASYDKAIQFKSDYSYAWTGRGYALEQLKRYDEALECYDKAIKFDPNEQYAINNRKNLLTKLGRSQ